MSRTMAENAYKEIQKFCIIRGKRFFVDLTKEEFINQAKLCMFEIPGWIVPLELEEKFTTDRKNFKLGYNWEHYYGVLKVFFAFEDDGNWYFNCEKFEDGLIDWKGLDGKR